MYFEKRQLFMPVNANLKS